MLRGAVVLALVVASIFICDISYDMYAPSLPQIGKFFGVSQTVVQLTVSVNLLGGSLSGLFYGPISDYRGRRPVLLFGITIFVLSSIVCCFANSIATLILARFFQGLGTGVAGVVGYAIVNDIYSKEECAKSLSIVNMVISFSPIIGPIIGSYVVTYGYGWRLLFMLVACLGIALLILLFVLLRETITEKRDSISCKSVLSEYAGLFRKKRFVGFALIQSLTIMWIWGTLASLPFIFIEGMNVPVKHYGYLVAISVVSYVIGTLANRKLLGILSMNKIIVIGLALSILQDAVVLVYHYCVGPLSAVLIEVIWVPSSFGIAFITNNSMASAFGEVQGKGGASSLIIFGQTVFGALGIYIMGKFYNGTIVPVSVLPMICSTIGLCLMYFLRSKKRYRVPCSA